jgi:hypothetical protein
VLQCREILPRINGVEHGVRRASSMYILLSEGFYRTNALTH